MSAASLRALLVWRRNLQVYRRTFLVSALPPFMEPLLYIVGFGLGIGALVKEVPWEGRLVAYTAFVAPGMIAVSAMQQAFFECTFGTFVRMYYQKTFDAIIATPCSLEDVVLGEILWGATKSVIATGLMLPVLAAFGLVDFPGGLWTLPVSFLAGWAFAALGLCVAALASHIELFNVPIFLVIMPMFVLSETFFPLPASGLLREVGNVLPLTQVSRLCRSATLGGFSLATAWPLLLGLAAMGAGLTALGIRLMRRRLIP